MGVSTIISYSWKFANSRHLCKGCRNIHSENGPLILFRYIDMFSIENKIHVYKTILTSIIILIRLIVYLKTGRSLF
jgi:CRISPR-associated protein Cas8b1/Cst1 subtype I-B